MSDKKHIDRLFQESFKDFEATPSDAVWENIEAQLNQKKKKRRVVPIWWRYAGVAALLLLLLTVGINYFNADNNTQTNQIVDTEDNNSTEQNNESNGFEELKKGEEIITDNNTPKNNLNEAIADTNSEEDKFQKSSQNGTILNDKINALKESAVAETSASQNKNERRGNANLSSKEKSNIKNSVLKTEHETVIASNLNGEKGDDKSIQNKENELLINKNEASKILNEASKNNTGIAQNDTSKEEKSKTVVENKTEDNGLTIEEAINKTEEDIIEEEKLNRWSIAPNAAPVYFNTLGEGSSIDPQFNSNSKTGELNMSYGISASYAVNKKLSIRSGVNSVNLGYNTNNVVVFQSVGVSSSSRALRNVDIGGGGSNNVSDALTNGSNESLSIISGESLDAKVRPESFSTNTSINQALAYVEVPIEIQYSLSNKKFGLNVIGGFSSFFLSDNKIFSEAESGPRTFLGEATNINKVSYSANFGLGLNYQVSKKIDLNLEPMFKYQINTFNNTSGDFQPFFIGVYTGFAIKF